MKKSLSAVLALAMLQGVTMVCSSSFARADDSSEIMKNMTVKDTLASVTTYIDLVLTDLSHKKPDDKSGSVWLAEILDESRTALSKNIPMLTNNDRMTLYGKQWTIAILLAERFREVPIDQQNFSMLRQHYVITEIKYLRRMLIWASESKRESEAPVVNSAMSDNEDTKRREKRALEADYLINRYSILNGAVSALMNWSYRQPPKVDDEYKRVVEYYQKVTQTVQKADPENSSALFPGTEKSGTPTQK